MATETKLKKVALLAKKLQTVGDPTRLKILCHLFKAKKACVSDIGLELGMNVAIVSHHLQVLSKEGLLEFDREGKKICYHLSGEDFMKDLKRFVCKYE